MFIVKAFIKSKLSFILLVTALLLGATSIYLTPKEEEPQIIVPLADVIVNVPGADPGEVEKLVATPLERLLWQIDGVEYVYSVSRKDMAVVTIRFRVGEDETKSLVKLHNKIMMNKDQVPGIVKNWFIKPVSIDDVPIVNISLYSKIYNDNVLRRVGDEVLAKLSELENISSTGIHGGRPDETRVEIDIEKLKGYNISMEEIISSLKGGDASTMAGDISFGNKSFFVSSSSFFKTPLELKTFVVGVHNGRPVYLSEVGKIISGPSEAVSYTRIGFSKKLRSENSFYPDQAPAVTLSIAKKKGTNAVGVAKDIIKKVNELKKTIIPHGIEVEITRDYGKTAGEKVNSLLSSLGFAIICVVVLLALSIGVKEAVIVAVAVPVSFGLALFCNYLFGYTINRVTLFALILSLGLVVDDPITNVDNIKRHLEINGKDRLKAALDGIKEVFSPVVMSTLAIIVCFVPLFFITGMMGPYMGPMAVNVPLTVIFSTLCALTIVPWISNRILKPGTPTGSSEEGVSPFFEKIYKRILTPFLNEKRKRYYLLASVIIVFILSIALAGLKLVPLKLLPFDNKNEFQILIDMPEGTTLESTDRVVRIFENYLENMEEVTSYVSFSGISSPMDFNGMVRHYYFRSSPNLADIRVNLVDKSQRKIKSHGIILKIRRDIEELALKNNALVKLVEVPPGPPVLSTIVAEIYGSDLDNYEDLIKKGNILKSEVLSHEKGVVEIDDMAESKRDKIEFIIDKEKAGLHGVSTASILRALEIAVGGKTAVNIHKKGERNPYPVKIILPLERRSSITGLMQIPVRSSSGDMISIGEIVRVEKHDSFQPVYHKNLKRVVYVIAEMAGRAPGEAVLGMMKKTDKIFGKNNNIVWSGEGEWKITLRVFRDMGIAFAAALIAIYIILVVQSGSFFMPVLIMMAIPLTILGIMPGFFILNLITGKTTGGFYDPVFFTATGMIGMIALGGIVIRNSLVLIEFIQERTGKGEDLKTSVIKSGSIRFRPIVLTALTTAIGAIPITFDPVFSGLAWSLIFGISASTIFTLVIVPVAYFSAFNKG